MSNPLGEHGLLLHNEWPPLDRAHIIHIAVMTIFGFLIGYLVKKAMK